MTIGQANNTMSSSSRRPSKLTGGCLCGAIRFTITWSDDMPWPPAKSGTCQCTKCRKFTGSLIPQNMLLPTKSFHPPLNSNANPTYKLYRSSATTSRGFCSECGSSIAFVSDEDAEHVELHIGAFDEDVLCGKKMDEEDKGEGEKKQGESIMKGNVVDDEYGRRTKRVDRGWGRELGYTENHIWTENAIVGVTDQLPGQKWLKDRTARPVEGSLRAKL